MEVAWQSRKVRVMGRVVDQPRLIAYMADDPAINYTYSGLTLDPNPWSPSVAEIKVNQLFTSEAPPAQVLFICNPTAAPASDWDCICAWLQTRVQGMADTYLLN